MLISMTGFSSAIISVPIQDAQTGTRQELQLSLTLKTLNSRFFETSCRLPTSLSSLETELIKHFKKELHRGTIQFTIYMSSPSALTGVVQPALSTVRGYMTALETIQKECRLPGTLSIQDLIHLPNIFETKETPLSQETIDTIWKAVLNLTDICKKVRLEEGISLERDLLERVELIRAALHQLEPRAQEVMALKKKQLLEDLRTLLSDVSSDLSAESQISATYNQLKKNEIHEELVRLSTHLDTLANIIISPEISKGKKIDFTLQELFRETNTIDSKSCDALISSLAITIKVELEKAREQAQNIV